MANMGVRASMSISVIVDGRLWGLISCANHSGPRFVSFELRSACEVLGRLTSLQIEAFGHAEASQARTNRQGTLEALARAMRASEDVLGGLLSEPGALLSLVNAQGAAAVQDARISTCGITPSAEAIAQLLPWVEGRDDREIATTSGLAESGYRAAEAIAKQAAGLLSFSLPGTPRRRLLWFRPELVQQVAWGGNPDKPAQLGPDQRLHPRRSFELWKQEVRLRSLPWTEIERDAATDLRRQMLEVDLEKRLVREQRAVRARDDLVAVVSHDLKNPLHVIKLQTTLLRRPVGEDEPSSRLRAVAERIEKAVHRMDSLVHDLLDLAKIEAGRFVVEPHPEDVRDLLAEALELLRPVADAKAMTLSDEVHGVGSVRADRDRIFQVLSNLIGNAIKYTPQGGRVLVTVERRGEEALFSVVDDGPGIAPEHLGRLFDRYWQVRTGSTGGSGLGLYIAKGIVDAHGGRISVESRPPHGATFRFTLPLVD
jgi:light-regulated signal transduction histidine kinase (bacteriophytochrome)